MSTTSIRVDEKLLNRVRKVKGKHNTIANFVNSAIEEKLKRDRAAKDIGKGDIPLPADYVNVQKVKFIDPFGKEHPLK